MNPLRSLSVFILLICSHTSFCQQLLLGKNPYAMNKSAVLELNSDNQGLLLPRITDTALINALNPPDGMVIYFVPTRQMLWRANGYWKALAQTGNYITALTGDVTASGPGSTAATVTGLRGASLPALSSGFLKFNGTSWFFENTTYVTASGNTLQAVTTTGNTSNTGVILTENGNSPTNSYALKLLRANDANPQGYLIRAQNSAASSDLFTVNASGDVTGNSFIKSGGTSSQFLKADGSVDNNTYITATATQTLTNKTLSGASNTFSNIPNSALTNSTIGLTLGSTGTDAGVSGSPASLGGSLTLNLPSASASNRGLLTSTDWSTFNSKAPASGGTGYIQNQASTNQTADMRISGKALLGGASSDNGAVLQVTGNATISGNVAIGTTSPNASLDVNGDVAMRMGSYTASILINSNISIGKYAAVRISGPALAYSITGIAGGYDGRMLILYNATGVDMVLTHDDILSTASNRIYCADNTSITVEKRGCATLIYSATDSRWIVVSTTR